MSLLDLIAPDHAPLDTSESRGQAYLELACLAIGVDGVVSPAELHDTLEAIGPLEEFAEYEGDVERAELVARTLEACRRAGFEAVVRRAADALSEAREREAGVRLMAYVWSSRESVAPIENALLAYTAEAFGIERGRFEALLADLDAGDNSGRDS